jgi:hypothetical protein
LKRIEACSLVYSHRFAIFTGRRKFGLLFAHASLGCVLPFSASVRFLPSLRLKVLSSTLKVDAIFLMLRFLASSSTHMMWCSFNVATADTPSPGFPEQGMPYPFPKIHRASVPM